jgi:glucose/arabinose dehydrogenase
LLRDSDADGKVDLRTTFLDKLYSPFGMALVEDTFYVGNSDAVMSYLYTDGATQLKGPSRKLLDLPAGTINRHWTKNLIAGADDKLYVAVGSNSNIGEFGMNNEEGRAAIWQVDRLNGKYRIFASGLRNPNGMDFSPAGTLWTAVNERDEIGGDLVPDYMTSVKDGGFYGWPYSYYGQVVDERVQPQRPDLVARAIKPDYALGAHTASLGLTFARGNTLGPDYQSGVFIGQHGSWNRRPRHGYRVIYIPFNGETPAGMPREVLTGFLGPDGTARGRPVGVAIDRTGALLVADDVGNVIWRVTRQ